MKELQRIESRETFPTPDRPMYIINLMKGVATFYLHGKEMDEAECGNMLINLDRALNEAEKQIEVLQNWIAQYEPTETDIDKYTLSDYLEEYPVEKDYKEEYKLQDLREYLFHAMMLKDEKMISQYINKIHVLEAKTQSLTTNT